MPKHLNARMLIGTAAVFVLAGSVFLTQSAWSRGSSASCLDDETTEEELSSVGAEQCDDERGQQAGAIDDGANLLPLAGISLDRAIEAAQGAASGTIGEVDLEYYRGKLVFNVDIGKSDVKVDAQTGEILGVGQD